MALIIIYNHQFNENIDKLEVIYRGKFSQIFHLVPFYQGNKSNVIAVYESSFYFQGYVSQGFRHFFREDFDHYIFVADDMILNPKIHEGNYQDYFKLTVSTSFIPGWIQFHEIRTWWQRTSEAFCWDVRLRGVEASQQLPSYNEAATRMGNFGLELKPLALSQILRTPFDLAFWEAPLSSFSSLIRGLVQIAFGGLRKGRKLTLPYPLVGSYSDIFVVDKGAIRDFCHLSGVFAATELFVEVAVPSALVLSASHIVTEEDLDLKGRALWTKEDLAVLDPYQQNLDELIRNFPEGYLYLHPVKLSKWKSAIS